MKIYYSYSYQLLQNIPKLLFKPQEYYKKNQRFLYLLTPYKIFQEFQASIIKIFYKSFYKHLILTSDYSTNYIIL